MPNLDAGLFTNLIIVAGLALVVVAVGFLADWRWALLLGGFLTVAGAMYVQRYLLPPVTQQDGKVTQIKKAG